MQQHLQAADNLPASPADRLRQRGRPGVVNRVQQHRNHRKTRRVPRRRFGRNRADEDLGALDLSSQAGVDHIDVGQIGERGARPQSCPEVEQSGGPVRTARRHGDVGDAHGG